MKPSPSTPTRWMAPARAAAFQLWWRSTITSSWSSNATTGASASERSSRPRTRRSFASTSTARPMSAMSPSLRQRLSCGQGHQDRSLPRPRRQHPGRARQQGAGEVGRTGHRPTSQGRQVPPAGGHRQRLQRDPERRRRAVRRVFPVHRRRSFRLLDPVPTRPDHRLFFHRRPASALAELEAVTSSCPACCTPIRCRPPTSATMFGRSLTRTTRTTTTTTATTTTNRENKRHFAPAPAAPSPAPPTGGHALPTSSVKHRSFWLSAKTRWPARFCTSLKALANRVRRSRRRDEESAGSLAGTFFKEYLWVLYERWW